VTRYLTLDDAIQAMGRLGFVARDLGLLSSALARPATTVGGVDAYETLERKAAALLESVVRNHSVVDGNKRLGWVLTSLFLWINGVRLAAPADAAFDLVVGLAEGRHELDDIDAAISGWSARRGPNPQPSDP
jgi:death on curing protein